MVTVAEVLEILSAASTIAIVLGVPFIYLQMRQNARLVEAAKLQTELIASQNRSQVMLHLAEHLTDREFVLQRKVVRDIVAKRAASGWDGFVDSSDGFEVRAFAIQYESAALMVRLGLIEERLLLETLGPLVFVDWDCLRPALARFDEMWGRTSFPNFRAVALQAEELWKSRGEQIRPTGSAAPAR